MNAHIRSDATRPLLILGHPPTAADLALRRVLRAKQRGQTLVVVDYQGSLTALLNERNKGNLHKGPLMWCDLADRRRPIALFRFKHAEGTKFALQGFLENCASLSAKPISAAVISMAADIGHRLAERGTIGLVALLRALRRPELTHGLRRDRDLAADLERLDALLEWILRFPAVWGLSEGNNPIDIARAVQLGGTIWLELSGEHFERVEHRIVSWMVDAALASALRVWQVEQETKTRRRPAPTLVHAFPRVFPLTMACGEIEAKQIGIFPFSAREALPSVARPWLERQADCWIAGYVGELPGNAATEWLNERERTRLAQLQVGEVWVRSGKDGRAVTVYARKPENSDALAEAFRRQAARRRFLTPIKQFSSALASNEDSIPKHTDLYRNLCREPALCAGWFRVKTHNRLSHGGDGVTIATFASRVDTELALLGTELSEGRYRCRPLRIARIPKADGEFRILKIACVRDRVAQAACLHLIEPLFDARFSPCSFAYRPGRNAHHALALARAAIRDGKHWAVTADIRKCFDSIDHDILLRLVGDVIGDTDLLDLIRHWLATDVIDFMDVFPSELGVPQGEAISPLLANIYLDPLDKEFERNGMTFVRYADDYVVLCATEVEAQAALRLMAEFLQGVLRLELKPAKTHYCHVDEGVAFLGFVLGRSDAWLPPGKIDDTLRTLGEWVERMASDTFTTLEKCQHVITLNSIVRGFRNYFRIDNAPAIERQLADMDVALDRCARGRLSTEHGVELAFAQRERFIDVDAESIEVGTTITVGGLTGAYPGADGGAPLEATARATPPWGGSLHAEVQPVAESPINRVVAIQAAESATEADVVVVDGRMHVMTSGCYVTVSGDDLIVRQRKKEVFRQAMAALNMVYLEGKGIALSADLTMRLCEADVPVVFTPLVGIPAAVAQPVRTSRSGLREKQVLRRSDPDIMKVGIEMLAAKVANQASVLKYFARYRKKIQGDAYHSLTQCADELREISAILGGLDPTAASARAIAMGHEGRAAARYWAAFGSLISADVGFPGRHTRHATDPVNSAINYVYGMLYGEVWRTVVRAGLDPYFGIVHGTDRDQGSLVFDLIEEYRAPFGDRLVLGMAGRGFSFELTQEGRLRSGARRKLVDAFHKQWHRKVRWNGKMRAWGELLELQVMNLKNAYLGKDDFRPFRFKW